MNYQCAAQRRVWLGVSVWCRARTWGWHNLFKLVEAIEQLLAKLEGGK